MSKEKTYQQQYHNLIEEQTAAYSGSACRVYCEDFSVAYDDVLQEHSPFIGGSDTSSYTTLKNQYGIVGLREKIKAFNEKALKEHLTKHQLTLSLDEAVDELYKDFVARFFNARGKVEDQYALIFVQNCYLPNELPRSHTFKGSKTPFEYNVIHYEDATQEYSHKNSFYTIRERRIPLPVNNTNAASKKQSERPDFVHYINGIPLFIIEIKTENSGLINSLKDFEYKETYDLAPFKVALNDGRDVLVFADMRVLKFNTGKDLSFKWVHYLPEKKNTGLRPYTNMDYLLEELFCQPENMYSYCLYGCSVIQGEETKERYLINARIQQYFALKSVLSSLKRIAGGHKEVPYNYIFEHAQRSGKTITMKLIAYTIENQFKKVFNSIFFYTPDLQIKKVITKELTQSGNAKVKVYTIETREAFENVIMEMNADEEKGLFDQRAAFNVYIVNMQKFDTGADSIFGSSNTQKYKPVQSRRILNIIDEAHHGQTKSTALQRDILFPNASNYLFTATSKVGTYAYYFDSNRELHKDNSNRFTISHAKACNITVPVYYFSAEKTATLSARLKVLSQKIEDKIKETNRFMADVNGLDLSEEELVAVDKKENKKAAKEVSKKLKTELYPEKLTYICDFMDTVKAGLAFAPKAIVYVESIESAKGYINYIQSQPDGKNNFFNGYRFGTDFSSMGDDCETYNPGIPASKKENNVSANFEKDRVKDVKNDLIIDILFAVDKYQKGFDLPTLLVTFLDLNINEPSVMNQIYTRSATKFPGKTCGYCVDIAFGEAENNAKTYRESIAVYDSEEIGDSLLNQDYLLEKKQLIETAIQDMRTELRFEEHVRMTTESILDRVLNEKDRNLREKHQSVFFRKSRDVFKALREIGTPLGFTPMPADLTAVLNSFNIFKDIYGDRNHPEHEKILINTDETRDDIARIGTDEIKTIIQEAMQLMQLSHIKELIKISFNQYTEVETTDLAQATFQKQLKSEAKKQEIEKNHSDYADFLAYEDASLLEQIEELLSRISKNRSIITEPEIQNEIDNVAQQFQVLKLKIDQTVKTKHAGNYAEFWTYTQLKSQLTKKTFTAQELDTLEPFIAYISSELGLAINKAAQQVPNYSDPHQKAQETLVRLFQTQDFTARQTGAYLTKYGQTVDPHVFRELLAIGRGQRLIKEFPYFDASLTEFQDFMKTVIHRTLVIG
jgi:type I site-specific restriction-modification system R (restriction) subunit